MKGNDYTEELKAILIILRTLDPLSEIGKQWVLRKVIQSGREKRMTNHVCNEFKLI